MVKSEEWARETRWEEVEIKACHLFFSPLDPAVGGEEAGKEKKS